MPTQTRVLAIVSTISTNSYNPVPAAAKKACGKMSPQTNCPNGYSRNNLRTTIIYLKERAGALSPALVLQLYLWTYSGPFVGGSVGAGPGSVGIGGISLGIG